jgi:thymidylate synthase
MFLGVPFDIASYAALTHLVANQVGLKARNLKITLGDTHIYENHVEQVQEYLNRQIPDDKVEIFIGEGATIDNTQFMDFKLVNYYPLSTIKATVAV